MPLNLKSTGDVVAASDHNELVNVLQRSAGQTETGTYFLTGFETGTTQSLGAWVPSLSRTSTPVSVTIDTSIVSPSFCASPSTDHLTSNGFHVYTNSSGASGNAMNVAGNFTIQY